MKPAAEWLAEGTADRPDDFAMEELKDALAWIERIQTDAGADLVHKLVKLRAAVLAYLSEPTTERRALMAGVMAETRP